MNATVVGLVTPHLLRIVDLASNAEKAAINVDFHVRDTVARTMEELSLQYNATALVTAYIEGLENAAGQVPRIRAAYIEGLENAAGQVPRIRAAYINTLQAAAAAARNLRRD